MSSTPRPCRKAKMPKEYDGLWRDRLKPSQEGAAGRSRDWWSVTDERSALNAAEDVVAQLQGGATAQLRRLLDRNNMIATIRDQDLGFFRGPHHSVNYQFALAYLLADDGPSEELSELLNRLLNESAGARDDLRRIAEGRVGSIREWAASRASEADKARLSSAARAGKTGGVVTRTTVLWKWEDEEPDGGGVGPVWIDSFGADPDKPEMSEEDHWVRRSEAQRFAQEHAFEFFADE